VGAETVIPLQEQDRLRQYFAEQLTGGVKIEHFTQRPLSIVVAGRDECRLCDETRTLLEDLRALSPKISLRVQEISEAGKAAAAAGVERAPATIVRGQLNRPLRFEGFMGAGLFPPFVDALVNAARGSTNLDARLKKRLDRIRDRASVRVYVGLSSPFSASMVQTAYAYALENQRLRVTVVEVEEFPRVAQALQIGAVPYTIVNDRLRFAGALPAEVFLEMIARGAEGRGLTAAESLLQRPLGPTTPLAQAQEPQQPQRTASGLILPGRG
jgi:alkyl hydroperoxide reductase subunit AhpF